MAILGSCHSRLQGILLHKLGESHYVVERQEAFESMTLSRQSSNRAGVRLTRVDRRAVVMSCCCECCFGFESDFEADINGFGVIFAGLPLADNHSFFAIGLQRK